MEVAQKKFSLLSISEGVTLIKADIQTMNTDNIEPFDMILTVNTLYYVASLELALGAAARLLKGNGKIFLLHVLMMHMHIMCRYCFTVNID